MLKYISADWIFPVGEALIENGVVVVSADGQIIEVLSASEATALSEPIEKYQGAIVPGFVNTHCHLELSHLLGQIPEHTGLVQFVQSIIKNRQSSTEAIQQGMEAADAAMYKNGIVAVGDISNQIISKTVKEKSKLYYHTFVEAMGFNPARADEIMATAKKLKAAFSPLPTSIVPHAPYSVSKELFASIFAEAEADPSFLSIHNQETPHENAFFQEKTGDFLKLYTCLGLDISFFTPSGKTSLQTWLPHVRNQKMLLVHNTQTDKKDIDFAQQHGATLYWCLCPLANKYIENALPDVNMLASENIQITLGTDSLASNHQLNILAEMQLLQKEKGIPFETLLKWATQNGAAFLELSNQFGSIEKGKKPGLNLIKLSSDFQILSDEVERLI
ncbi:amidohydrolase family protein [Pedobacter sp. MW01-1-1]|uniref:amidohydrolase family protein n=1 Tax=Pedobacter sp. MW01-1-1 TaxID=3383027 RepID=UPI003FF148D1